MLEPVFIIDRSDSSPFFCVRTLVPRDSEHRQALLCEPAIAFDTEAKALRRIEQTLLLRANAARCQLLLINQALSETAQRRENLAS